MKFDVKALAAIAAFAAAPAVAQEGDAAAGEKAFNQCLTCHVVVDDAGTVIAGRNAKTGPNLYGVVGRTAGTYPEFKYKDSIIALGASGFAWTEEDIATYVKDPGAFLKEKLDDKKAKTGMAFKLAKGGEDVAAYLASVVK